MVIIFCATFVPQLICNVLVISLHKDLGEDPNNVQDCSPHIYFILKGSEISIEGLVQIQDINPRKEKMNYKIHIQLVHDLYNTSFQYNVKNEETTI
jgi:hypothetical protein